jgi:hypothetical protein
MTYRNLIENILRNIENIDDEAKVVILYRDSDFVLEYKKKVSCSRLSLEGICVENIDINNVKKTY